MSVEAALPGRLLMRQLRTGVIATHSIRFPGYPYGSAVPYSLDARGRPILLISQLAAHTQNIGENPRASLTAHQTDVVTGSRITLLGEVVRIERNDPGALRYLALFPDAAAYAGFGDFGFFRLEPTAGHYIGGFGDIRWFDARDFILPACALDDHESDIVSHMNHDHARALIEYCHHRFGITPRETQMVTIDADGFDVLADGQALRFEFSALVTDPDSARRELIRLSRQARGGAGDRP